MAQYDAVDHKDDMDETQFQIFQEQQRSNWVRLRTLVTLRWFAILGQITAIVVAVQVFELQIEVGLAAIVIGSSILANLFSSFLYPENRRLTEREATLMLLFDIIQLALLLFIAGGLNNPFSLLIMAPVTIAATVLHRRSMIIVGMTAIIVITFVSTFHIPIASSDGSVLSLPYIFQFGFWAALVIGIVFLSGYTRQITTEMHAMGDALLATQLALAREQKLTDLGGVVAAAAHELGTPLATIKLVSSELSEEFKDETELLEDIHLIQSQADRCREILRSMGRAGKDDSLLRVAPIEAVVREAAEPHLNRGKHILFSVAAELEDPSSHPTIARRPEIIHGLRNLIQNAVDFSEHRVEIKVGWSQETVTIRIIDDGPGIPASVIGRIGDPFVRRKRSALDENSRPEYSGMGLGLFIAKTLLERSSANLTFANVPAQNSKAKKTGAIVTVSWPREMVEDSETLEENQPFLP